MVELPVALLARAEFPHAGVWERSIANPNEGTWESDRTPSLERPEIVQRIGHSDDHHHHPLELRPPDKP